MAFPGSLTQALTIDGVAQETTLPYISCYFDDIGSNMRVVCKVKRNPPGTDESSGKAMATKFVSWTFFGVEPEWKTETTSRLCRSNPLGQGTASGTLRCVANFETYTGPSHKWEVHLYALPEEGGLLEGAGSYSTGDECTIKATPATGYKFRFWNPGAEPAYSSPYQDPEYTFYVYEDWTWYAHFEPPQEYEVKTYHYPDNAGVEVGAGKYMEDTFFTLTATANEGFEFKDWVKDSEVVSTEATMTTVMVSTTAGEYIAEYNPLDYEITTSHTPEEGGTESGAGTYPNTSYAPLAATPNDGYRFVNWTKDGEEVSNEASFLLEVLPSTAGEYVANYEEIIVPKYTITVEADPSGAGTVSGGGEYSEGDRCTISAEDYIKHDYNDLEHWESEFEYWESGGVRVSGESSYTFTVSKNQTFTAHFKWLSGHSQFMAYTN